MAGESVDVIRKLCFYGFFVEFKPSEPYLNEYLVENKGFSNLQTETLIYPYATYNQLLMLLILPYIAHVKGYHLVLVMESIAFLGTRILLIYGTGLPAMQFMQALYAMGTASKVVYYSYLYELLPRKQFAFATGVVWGAQAAGQFAAGICGQMLRSIDISLLTLNYISCCNVLVAFSIVWLLPPAHVSMDAPLCTTFKEILLQQLRNPLDMFIWIGITCSSDLLQNYIQNIWDSSFHSQWNGISVSLFMLLGTIASSCTPLEWKRSQWIHASITVLMPVLVWIIALSSIPSTSYISYTLYGGCYYFIITSVTNEVAEHGYESHNHALVFGMNFCIASTLEALVTFVFGLTESSVEHWFFLLALVQTGVSGVYLCGLVLKSIVSGPKREEKFHLLP